jgi:hypothetical protein
MSKTSEIIRKFRERVDLKDITEDLKVVYRIAGGMPSERVEEELQLTGSGKARVKERDVLKSIPAREVSRELDESEVIDLFRKVGPGLDSLVPREEARFLPDSLIGSITIEVDGEETILFFLADEEQRLAQDKPIAPQVAEVVQHFRGISQRLLKKGRRKKNE